MAQDETTILSLTPPANTAQYRAANVYKSNAFHGISERDMMAQIFQKAIKHLYAGRDAYLASNFEGMLEQNSKAIHIFDVLREDLLASDALKDAEAAAPARFLLQSYTSLIERIANVLQTKPPEDAFTAIIDTIKPIYQAWLPPKPEQAGNGEPNINTAG
jgi:flagellin-specific chaperone FliS